MLNLIKKFKVVILLFVALYSCIIFTALFALFAADLQVIFSENFKSKSDLTKNTIIFAENVELDSELKKSGVLITQELEVNDEVDGNLVAAVEGEAIINNKIGNNLLVAGDYLEVNDSVGDDVLMDVEELVIDDSAHIKGNLKGQTNRAEIDGDVDGRINIEEANYVKITGKIGGDVKIIADKVELDGTFEKDIEVKADELVVSSDTVAKSLSYDVDDTFQNDSSNIDQVKEKDLSTHIRDNHKADFKVESNKFVDWVFEAIFLVVFTVLGFVFFRERIQKFSQMVVDNPLMFLKLGVIHLVLMIIGMIGFAVTLIFIPFTLIIALIIFVQYLATIPFAAYMAYEVLERKYEFETEFQRLGVLSSVAVAILIATKVPLFGWLIHLVIFLLTVGVSTRVFSRIRAD